MQEEIRINPEIAVGGQPSPEELRELRRKGFRGVINVRTSGEEEQPLEPEIEGERVRQLGMEYAHIPVSSGRLSEQLVDRFRSTISSMAKPVYVHCRTGKRSGALSMMHMGVDTHMSGDEVLARAEELGFECDEEELAGFVRDYVNEHTRH